MFVQTLNTPNPNSLKILSIKFSSFSNLFISKEIGEILSTTTLANFCLNSEKFFPENSLIVLTND